jgi:hypothetical protein
MTGMLSGVWVIPEFEPVGHIPSGTKLTSVHSNDLSGAAGFAALGDIVTGVVAAGTGRTWTGCSSWTGLSRRTATWRTTGRSGRSSC